MERAFSGHIVFSYSVNDCVIGLNFATPPVFVCANQIEPCGSTVIARGWVHGVGILNS